MKKTYRKLLIVAVPVIVIAIAIVLFTGNPKQKIVREAYIYGYPLVTMDMTRRQQTNVRLPDDAHAPMGQLIKMRAYPAVDNKGAAAPNADTMYTMVWYDVSTEPWVFSIPDMGDRFYIMPMLSSFNEVFHVAGSRATGGKPQKFVITGPGWSGTLPEGVTQVKSPTALVWILRAHLLHRHAGGLQGGARAARQFSSVPLSAYGKPYTPPAGVVDEKFDMKKAVRKQVNDLPLEEYLQLPRPAAEDEPAETGGRADHRAHGEDRDRAGTGVRPQQAACAGPEARSEAGAPGDGRGHEGQEAGQRLALLDQQRGQLRDRL